MKIFLAYHFKGEDKEQLKNLLLNVSKIIEELGHKSFCFFRDIQNWGNLPTERLNIIPVALQNLDTCDALLALVISPGKSLGLGIEVGYAKAKGKKIFLAKKPELETDYLESVSEKFIVFQDEIPTKENLAKLLSE